MHDYYDKKQGLQHEKSVCLVSSPPPSSIISTAKLEEKMKEWFVHWSLRLLFIFLVMLSLHLQIPLHLGVLNRQVGNITRMSAVQQRPPLIKR